MAPGRNGRSLRLRCVAEFEDREIVSVITNGGVEPAT